MPKAKFSALEGTNHQSSALVSPLLELQQFHHLSQLVIFLVNMNCLKMHSSWRKQIKAFSLGDFWTLNNLWIFPCLTKLLAIIHMELNHCSVKGMCNQIFLLLLHHFEAALLPLSLSVSTSASIIHFKGSASKIFSGTPQLLSFHDYQYNNLSFLFCTWNPDTLSINKQLTDIHR